jgi:hypothetical protein
MAGDSYLEELGFSKYYYKTGTTILQLNIGMLMISSWLSVPYQLILV